MRRSHHNAIGSLRQLQDWRQQDLADQVGLSRSLIGRYERGEQLPNLRTAFRIAVAMGHPVHEVFWGLHQETLWHVLS